MLHLVQVLGNERSKFDIIYLVLGYEAKCSKAIGYKFGRFVYSVNCPVNAPEGGERRVGVTPPSLWEGSHGGGAPLRVG
jgi:hypothetical protein